MSGRVYKPKGATSWYYVVDIGHHADGRRKQQKRAFPTKREAERELRKVLDAVDAGKHVGTDRITVGQFLVDEWLPAARHTLKPASYEMAERMLRSHAVPRIGGIRLQDLGPQHLNAMYADLLDRGRLDGSGGLSEQTVMLVHARIRRALNDAVRWRRVTLNVATLADPPRVPKPKLRIWSGDELRSFVHRTRDDRLHVLWVLYCTTGIRRGEALGLRWIDVDLERGAMRVQQQRYMVSGKIITDEPKTAAARRTIALDAATVDLLRAHRQRQREDRMAWGPAWVDSGLVFTKENGDGLNPDEISRLFQRVLRAAGLPAIRLHDVRHSYATHALRVGVPVEVLSKRLGHADIAVTLRTYRHVMPGEDADAATLAAAGIFG